MKKYLSILLLLLFALSACDKDFKDGYILENEGKEFRDVIIFGSTEYRLDKIDVTEVEAGLKYISIQLVHEDMPLVAHAIQLDRTKSKLQLELFSGKDNLAGQETPSAIAKRKTTANKRVVATINGDFYNMATGIPLGAQVSNGITNKIVSPNWKVGFAMMDDGSLVMGNIKSMGSASSEGAGQIELSGVNSTRSANFLILFDSGNATTNTGTNPWGKEVLLEPIDADWENLASLENIKFKVANIGAEDTGSMEIPRGQIVLSGHGTAAVWLRKLTLGSEVMLNMSMATEANPNDVFKPTTLIGAHTIVIKDSAPVDAAGGDVVANARHPRTGIGFSADKNMITFLVVEGRRKEAVGVTTRELADVFAYFRMSNGVNLDGGGSSCMVLNDKVMNVLKDESERAVPNVLSFVENK